MTDVLESVYERRPWTAVWGDTTGFHDAAEAGSVLETFLRHRGAHPDAIALAYFDRTFTAAEVDTESDALAAAFQDAGLGQGDSVGLYVQNMSEFVVGALAAWKSGAAVVPINPMYRERELSHIVRDSGVSAMIALDDLLPIVRDATRDAPLRLLIATNGLRALADPAQRPTPLQGVEPAPLGGAQWYDDVVSANAGARPALFNPSPADVAFIAYTSGTTGAPKGAVLTHANVLFSAQTFRSMRRLDSSDVIFAMAPLFHVTGLICSVALGLLTAAPLVLGYRFDVPTVLGLIDRYRVTFTVGATTIFLSFLDRPGFDQVDISSLTKIICGGAPIPPSVVERYERATGVYLHNGYGLTETTSPTFGTPLGSRSPVSATGSLALGVPIPDTECKLLGDDGEEVAIGETGEIVVRGPHVMAGYWRNEAETALHLQDGWLRTGDMATMDADGWFYLVDRKKDQINAAGFKVWPQEVEEVLYEHPAVREAGVVGVPDERRGETVKAFVSLRPGASATDDELIAFCRERLAAYKVPRIVQFLDDLPKTVTGKITRRSLRELP
jgi:long-chain acyl-CoA synthetase